MPDSDECQRLQAAQRTTPRHLPVPIATPGETGDGWFDRLRAVFGLKPGTIRADLEAALAAHDAGEAGFSPEERPMLNNILGLRERRVDDVMVPRADIIAVQQDITLGELVAVFESAGHSRLPVFRETLDDPVGMVHINDLIAYMTARAAGRSARRTPSARSRGRRGLDLSASISRCRFGDAKLVRNILFVPPSMPVLDLLASMQATRMQLALVIDEYGGTDGLVSMEDIVELIVGDIEDEHDEDDTAADRARQPDGSSSPTPAPSSRTGRRGRHRFRRRRRGEEVDTVGGLVFARSAASRCAANWSRARACSSSRCSTPIRAASSGCASRA